MNYYLYIFMGAEALIFILSLSLIRNGMASETNYSRAYKFYIFTIILYILYFAIVGIVVLLFFKIWLPELDLTAVMIQYILVSFIFLIPRFVALCVAGSMKLTH